MQLYARKWKNTFRVHTRDWQRIFFETEKSHGNFASGRCTVTHLRGHQGGVQAVQFDESRVISGSRDASLMEWSLATGEPMRSVKQAHRDRVQCLQFDDRVLVSGSFDQSVRFWDPVSLEPRETCLRFEDKVRCLQLGEDWLVVGTVDEIHRVCWCACMLMMVV